MILSFMVDTSRVLAGGSSGWSGWPLFWAGMALAGVATATALTWPPRERARRVRLDHGTGGRPPVGSPN